MRPLVSQPDELGECPVWNISAARLEWLDIAGRRLSSCDADGGSLERMALPGKAASFAHRRSGGKIIAYRNRIALTDEAFAEQRSFVPDAIDIDRERFNDGACDPAGRFWVGTMALGMRDAVAALYRIGPDLTVRRMDAGFAVSNGIAWSPAADFLYHCDTAADRIYAHDFDLATGEISGKRVFAEIAHPDGCAMDSDGGLWVAQPGHGQVVRLDTAGAVSQVIAVPVRNPSSLAFGGAGRNELFVTSIGPQVLPDAAPLAGCLFKVSTAFRGVPVAKFAG